MFLTILAMRVAPQAIWMAPASRIAKKAIDMTFGMVSPDGNIRSSDSSNWPISEARIRAEAARGPETRIDRPPKMAPTNPRMTAP